MQKKYLSPLAALAVVFTSIPAWAGDKALAEELFRKAQAQMQKANATPAEVHQACQWYKESLDQDATLNTQVALAACYEKEGKNRSAWGLYTDAASGSGPAAQYAKDRADALYKQGFLKLRIEAKDLPESAKVTLDGESVGSGVINTDINADPGEHTIRVKAEGKKDFESKVELSKANSPLAVPVVLEDAPKETNVGGGGNNPPPVIVEQPQASPVRTAGVLIGITGVTAGVGGLIAEILAQVFDANATKSPPANCMTTPNADLCQWKSKAKGAQTAAITLAVIGGALIVTGVVMYFVGAPKKPEAKASSWHILPSVGPGGGGGMIYGTF